MEPTNQDREKKDSAYRRTHAAVAPPTEIRAVSGSSIFRHVGGQSQSCGGDRPDEAPAANGGAEKENGKPPDETSELKAAAAAEYPKHRNAKLSYIGWINGSAILNPLGNLPTTVRREMVPKVYPREVKREGEFP